MPSPFRTVVLEEVGSTNREAFQRAEAGEAGPLWIVARRQTAGRGRSGRQWASEPGNLYASLLAAMDCPPAAVPQLSLVAGVAAMDAIVQVAGAALTGLRLKWPNDILIGQAKCAGILAESITGRDSVIAVIGIGINLAWHPTDLGRDATSLAERGVRVSPDAMLEALAPSMKNWIEIWRCGAGFAGVRQAWLERAGPVGERCSVNTGAERVEGAFIGLDASGALIMTDQAQRQRTIAFGDVTLGPTAAGSIN